MEEGKRVFVSKRVGRRRVSVIAPISTYLQRATCFTDSKNIIMSVEAERRQPTISKLVGFQLFFLSSYQETIDFFASVFLK